MTWKAPQTLYRSPRSTHARSKTFFLTLLLSHGVPMIFGGDEFRRTQHGNNNAYCQDNEVGWWLWDHLDEHANIHRFVRELITARQTHLPLKHAGFYTDEDLRWIGSHDRPPRWKDPETRAVGCYLPEKEDLAVLLLFNVGLAAVDFHLPALPNNRVWRRKADAARPSPDDLYPLGETQPLDQREHYTVDPRASAILIAEQ